MPSGRFPVMLDHVMPVLVVLKTRSPPSSREIAYATAELPGWTTTRRTAAPGNPVERRCQLAPSSLVNDTTPSELAA